MKLQTALIVAICLAVGANAQQTPAPHGRVENIHIPAPSLANNRFAMPAEQPVAVYLPPSYDGSDKTYPVVYYLPGFGDALAFYTAYGVFQGFALQASLDSLILRASLPEMIVVLVSTVTPLGGSYGVNSPVLGNWEDYIAHDVVNFIDHRYRTRRRPSSRGISGHSAGGYGALNLAMHEPDIFGAVYALSPGLFAPGALKENFMFSDTVVIRQYIETQQRLRQMPAADAKLTFLSLMSQWMTAEADWHRVFAYAYGSSFAADTTSPVPYIAYPYSITAGRLVMDSMVWARYENGFGGLMDKVNRYHDHLAGLAGIVIDVGTKDEYPWIPGGCKYFSTLLTQHAVRHELTTHDGGHQDRLRERIEGHMLPFFAQVLR